MAEESQSILGKVVAGVFAIAGLVAIKVLFFGAHHVDDVGRHLVRPAERAVAATDDVIRGAKNGAKGPLDDLERAGATSSDDLGGGLLAQKPTTTSSQVTTSEGPDAADVAGEFATGVAEDKLKSSLQNSDDEESSIIQSRAKRSVPSPP
ncbi:MAG: hypothetical protein SGJ23_11600 [Alphaproteobacteria bacterium]|nr:hypothetical protein [Alphaproteobacteria bacterium]MDZ4777419.1 hypothetical protein [Alphaproteobacteria bacterium]